MLLTNASPREAEFARQAISARSAYVGVKPQDAAFMSRSHLPSALLLAQSFRNRGALSGHIGLEVKTFFSGGAKKMLGRAEAHRGRNEKRCRFSGFMDKLEGFAVDNELDA